MNKKIVGILTILILVVAAGVFLLIDRSTNTKSKVVFEPPAPGSYTKD